MKDERADERKGSLSYDNGGRVKEREASANRSKREIGRHDTKRYV